MSNTGFEDLFNALTVNISAEEVMLSGLQGIIAAQISMKRQEMGMNQKDFAKYMGVSQSLISRWEQGDENFTLETLVKIASKLKLDMQCPFVTASAPMYYSAPNIIPFTGKSGWSSASYGSRNDYTELKEN